MPLQAQAPVRAPREVRPRVLLRHAVAVLLSRLPTATETYILREIDELERQGQPVRLVALRRDAPPVIPREVEPWIRHALSTPLLSAGIVVVNLRAMARRPGRYAALLARLVAGTLTRPVVLARTLALLPKSVYLAEQLRYEGVRHVHAYQGTSPATMALIITSLTDITFSITAHARDVVVAPSLLRLTLARARFVRVASDYDRGVLATRYPAETREKLRVIPRGIPLHHGGPTLATKNRFRLHAASPRANGVRPRRAAAQAPRLLPVAALRPSSGVHVLVDTCQRDFVLEGTMAALIAELDRHNPAPASEVQRALVAPPPLAAAVLSCRRIRAAQDACVVELLAVGNGGSQEWVVKIARTRPGESAPAGERTRREYLALTQLARVFGSAAPQGAAGAVARRAPPRLGVPRPLALDETRAAVWIECCSGQRLDHLIRAARFRRDPISWAALRVGARAAGEWLQRFQAWAPPCDLRSPQVVDLHRAPGDPRAPLRALVARTVAALDEVALSARARAEARAHLDTLATQVAGEALRVVPRHGDFWPGNVFVDKGAVQVIDFEGLGTGLPCEDVGWFLVTLELLFTYPLLSRRSASLAASFLDGYGSGASAAGLDPAALALGRLAAAAALVTRLPSGERRRHTALRAILGRG